MPRFVDAVITYRILKKLTTAFEDTAAYKLGIIDRHGKVLKKDRDLNTDEERDAYTILDRLVFRLKRIIEKIPTENKRLVSFAAALALIKEHVDDAQEYVFLERDFVSMEPSGEDLNEVSNFLNGQSMLTFRMFNEDGAMGGGIANSVGGGFSGQATPNPNPNLAGKDLGLGKKIFRRKKPNV